MSSNTASNTEANDALRQKVLDEVTDDLGQLPPEGMHDEQQYLIDLGCVEQTHQVVAAAIDFACDYFGGSTDAARRKVLAKITSFYRNQIDLLDSDCALGTSLIADDGVPEVVATFRSLAIMGLRDLYTKHEYEMTIPPEEEVDLIAGLLLDPNLSPIPSEHDISPAAEMTAAVDRHVDRRETRSQGSVTAARVDTQWSHGADPPSQSSPALKLIAEDSPIVHSEWGTTIPARPARATTNLDGVNARMAQERDIRRFLSEDMTGKWSTPIPGARLILESNERVTDRQDSVHQVNALPTATFTLSDEERSRHTLLIGPTGCGKSTGLIHPILRADIADRSKTVIVYDSKGGELLPLVEELNDEYRDGQPVVVIDFFNPDNSFGWNPLDAMRSFPEIRAFSQRLCRSTETRVAGQDSEFWLNASTKFLAAILWSLHQDEEESCTISRAQQIIEWRLADIKKWCHQHHDIPGIDSFVEYIDSGSHNAHTILADLQNRLSLWSDDRVCRTTSRDEVHLRKALATPSVIVLRTNEADASALKPLTNAFFTEVVATLFRLVEESPGGVLPIPVSLVIEEFASAVGKIPDFNRFINVVRSRGVSVTASIQSLSQLEFEYGQEAKPILAGFCSKFFFAGLSPEDAEYASSLFGSMTVEHREASYTHDTSSGYDSTAYSSEAVKIVHRPILTPHEIRLPVRHPELGQAVTVDLPATPPFQAFFTPSYYLDRFSKLLLRCAASRQIGKPRSEELKPLGNGRGPRPIDADPPSGQGVTDTKGWTKDRLLSLLEATKLKIGWEEATASARKWWGAFENENSARPAMVLRLAEELRNRRATITEFFLAYVYSNTDNIQANLYYLDYTRLKKEEDRKKLKSKQGRDKS